MCPKSRVHVLRWLLSGLAAISVISASPVLAAEGDRDAESDELFLDSSSRRDMFFGFSLQLIPNASSYNPGQQATVITRAIAQPGKLFRPTRYELLIRYPAPTLLQFFSILRVSEVSSETPPLDTTPHTLTAELYRRGTQRRIVFKQQLLQRVGAQLADIAAQLVTETNPKKRQRLEEAQTRWMALHDRYAGQVAELQQPGLSASVVLVASGENQPPSAVDDTLTVNEDSPASVLNVRANDTDPNLDTLTIVGISDPPHGVAAITGGGTAVSYTPDPNYNGPDSFTYTISDGHGGNDTATVTVTVIPDTVAPVAQITSPAEGKQTNAASINVAGTVDDTTATITVNGVAAILNGTNWTAQQVPLAEGPNTLTATATDPSNNAGTATRHVTRDSVAPVVAITNPPSGTRVVSSFVAIQGTVNDPQALIGVGGAPGQITTAPNWAASQVILAEGLNTIQALASDPVGNTSAPSTIEVIRDTTAPVVAITSPLANAVLGGNQVAVSGTVSDISPVTVQVNGLDASVNGNTFSLASLPLVQGTNQIIATATDTLGNLSSTTINVSVDTTPPAITIVSPVENAVFSESPVTVSGTVQDAAAVVTINSQPAVNTAGAFTLNVPVIEGPNTITAIATDALSRQQTDSVSVILDTAGPVVAITSPAENAELAGSPIRVAGTVQDLTSVTLDVNGLPATLSNGTWSVAEVLLTPGANTLTLTARDIFGHTTTLTRSVTRLIPPQLTFTSPGNMALLPAGTATITGTVDVPGSTVTVGEVAAVVTPGNPSTFSAQVPLHEGANHILGVATSPAGLVGTAVIHLGVDTSPPEVDITFPVDGAVVFDSTVDVAGVLLNVPAFPGDTATVLVNNIAASIGYQSFALSGVPLQLGSNTLTAVATDGPGNSATHTITVIRQEPTGQRIVEISGGGQAATVRTELPDPLVVELRDATNQPVADRAVNFSVTRGDGSFNTGGQSRRQLSLQTGVDGRASVQWTLGSHSGPGVNRVEATAPGFTGTALFLATANPGPATGVKGTMGFMQKGIAGQTLPFPLMAMAHDAAGNPVAGVPVRFEVVKGSGNLGGQPFMIMPTDAAGVTGALFTLGDEPGMNTHSVQASFPGASDEPVIFTATAAVPGRPEDTSLSGVVLDNSNDPIPHVAIRVLHTALETFTDAEGQFHLPQVPVGHLHVEADGTTTTRSGTWPVLHYELFTISGMDNTVGMPIYMPYIEVNNGQVVGGPQDLVLTMENVEGLAFKVFANSVTCAGGVPQCLVSVTQVHADKVPMPPAGGLIPRLTWTLQPPGTQFNPPVQVSLPNTDGLLPGQVTELYSFDHDIGMFVSIGPATVSQDGKVLVSDPGFGIAKSGWGYAGGSPPPSPTCASSCDDGNPCTSDSCSVGFCFHINNDTITPPQGPDDDCHREVCQGGAITSIIDDTEEAPGDPPNNCKRGKCVGGSPAGTENDDGDVPLPGDPQDCFREACHNGNPITVTDDSENPQNPIFDDPQDCINLVCRSGVKVNGPDNNEMPNDPGTDDDCMVWQCNGGSPIELPDPRDIFEAERPPQSSDDHDCYAEFCHEGNPVTLPDIRNVNNEIPLDTPGDCLIPIRCDWRDPFNANNNGVLEIVDTSDPACTAP